MIRKIFRDMSPGMGLFVTLVLAVSSFLIFLVLGIVASGFYTGVWDIHYLTSSSIDTPQGLGVIRILQIFQSFGLFIFPSILVAYLASDKTWNFLGFNKVSARLVLLSILLMLVALPGINLMASINAKVDMPQWMIEFEQTAERVIKALLQSQKPSMLFLNLFMIAVLPAIGEELLFRGVIQPYLCKAFRNTFLGVLVTAAFFSAFHMQFQGFLPRMVLGMIFGYLYVWTRSIWVPIVVHFFNNGLAVLVYYFVGRGDIPAQTESIGELSQYWQLGAASVLATALLTWVIYRERVTSE